MMGCVFVVLLGSVKFCQGRCCWGRCWCTRKSRSCGYGKFFGLRFFSRGCVNELIFSRLIINPNTVYSSSSIITAVHSMHALCLVRMNLSRLNVACVCVLFSLSLSCIICTTSSKQFCNFRFNFKNRKKSKWRRESRSTFTVTKIPYALMAFWRSLRR